MAAIRTLGGRVEMHGSTASEVKHRAQALAAREGWVVIDDFCDPMVAAGAGTLALEMLEDVPELDVVVVPVGGGALAAGCGAAAKGVARSAVASLHLGLEEPRRTE